jgi:hypothetical protein
MKKFLCVILLIAIMTVPVMAAEQPAERHVECMEKSIVSFKVIVIPAIGPVGPVVIIVPMRDGVDPEPDTKTWSDIKRMFT